MKPKFQEDAIPVSNELHALMQKYGRQGVDADTRVRCLMCAIYGFKPPDMSVDDFTVQTVEMICELFCTGSLATLTKDS
jgi:hypothetical protein